MHKSVTVWMGNAQGTRWEKRLSINMSKTRRKYGLTWRSLRYSIENCILKGNNIDAYFNTLPRKGIIWLRNPCSELVSNITNPVVVKHQEDFPRKELHASNTAIAGAEAAVNTPDTGAWGCRGTPRAVTEHGRVFWEGTGWVSAQEVPSQQKRGTGTAGGAGTLE